MIPEVFKCCGIGHSVDASMISRLLYSLRCSDGILHVLLYCFTFHPMAFLVSILSILICRLLIFIFTRPPHLQIQGLWKTKNQNMADLCKEAKELQDKFVSFQINHIVRVHAE